MIHETLKDHPNTKVYQNAKLKTSKGRNREFDVLIEGRVSDFSFRAGIECKSYKTPVGVKEVEAFNSKCERCGVTIKAIVSISGYQQDAIDAAKELGIQLFDVKSFDEKDILSFFPLVHVGTRVKILNFTTIIDIPEHELEDLRKVGFKTLYVEGEPDEKPITKFIENVLLAYAKEGFMTFNLQQFMISGGELDRRHKVELVIPIEGAAYLLKGERKIPILALVVNVETFLLKSDTPKVEGKFIESESGLQANHFKVNDKFGNEVQMVVTKDKTKFFSSRNGEVKEWSVLAKYDSKTKTFIYPNTEWGNTP